MGFKSIKTSSFKVGSSEDNVKLVMELQRIQQIQFSDLEGFEGCEEESGLSSLEDEGLNFLLLSERLNAIEEAKSYSTLGFILNNGTKPRNQNSTTNRKKIVEEVRALRKSLGVQVESSDEEILSNFY